jgi:hypothetical protein
MRSAAATEGERYPGNLREPGGINVRDHPPVSKISIGFGGQLQRRLFTELIILGSCSIPTALDFSRLAYQIHPAAQRF